MTFKPISPFNKDLKIIERLPNYKCKVLCFCGKEFTAWIADIRSGSTQSCKCKRRKAFGMCSANRAFNQLKQNAKKRKIQVDITFEDFLTISQKNCYYCDAVPANVNKQAQRSFGSFTYNGIDRYDNDIGYVLDNCKPCCAQCNTAKNFLSLNDFISWIKKVSERVKSYESV